MMMFKGLAPYRQLIVENSKIVLGLGGSLALLLFVFLPTVTRIPEGFEKTNQQKEELKKINARLQNVNNLLGLQQSLKASLELTDKALPSSEEIPSLMTQIQAVATESGVTLKALQFGGLAKTDTPTYRKITLQAVLEGSFANLSTFLKTLEKSSRIVDVESLTFDTRREEGKLSASLGLVAYFLDNAGTTAEKSKEAEPGVMTFTSKSGVETLDYLRKLKIYEVELTPTNVGKSNPFE